MALKKTGMMKWKISKLKEHKKQKEMFGDLPTEELQALAADMAQHGQRTPVEILPNGIIIAGHQRVRAAKRLGWKEMDVIVHHDLAKDPVAVETLLITDNLVRRQLSGLAQARCIQRLMEIELNKSARRFTNDQIEQAKQRIAVRVHLSPRSVNRYLLLLRAPMPIQEAFDRGQLPLVLAGKVANLTSDVRDTVAVRIRNGENPKQVVYEYVRKPTGHHVKVFDAVVSFARLLQCGLDDLEQRVEAVRPRHVEEFLDVLRRASDLIGKLVAKTPE